MGKELQKRINQKSSKLHSNLKEMSINGVSEGPLQEAVALWSWSFEGKTYFIGEDKVLKYTYQKAIDNYVMLLVACLSGDQNMTNMLVERGAHITTVLIDGHSTLHYAIQNNKQGVVEIFQNYIKSTEFTLDDALSILYHAKHNNEPEVAEMMQSHVESSVKARYALTDSEAQNVLCLKSLAFLPQDHSLTKKLIEIKEDLEVIQTSVTNHTPLPHLLSNIRKILVTKDDEGRLINQKSGEFAVEEAEKQALEFYRKLSPTCSDTVVKSLMEEAPLNSHAQRQLKDWETDSLAKCTQLPQIIQSILENKISGEMLEKLGSIKSFLRDNDGTIKHMFASLDLPEYNKIEDNGTTIPAEEYILGSIEQESTTPLLAEVTS